MKRTLAMVSVLALALVVAVPVIAADRGPHVRVVHASPDAPAVDVWADGSPAFQNAPFKGVTSYAELTPGTHNFKVVPAGATEPVVIDATLDLQANADYTILAVNTLDMIEPLVLADDNTLPAAGKAHVRFVHASPDAPAVDIAVADGGPVLFSSAAFKDATSYLPVDAGTYDLEARLAGTDVVALSLPGTTLQDGYVYTVYAMGFAGGGDPALTAVISVDAQRGMMLPATGGGNVALFSGLVALGLALVVLSVRLRSRSAVKVEQS